MAVACSYYTCLLPMGQSIMSDPEITAFLD